MPLTPISLCEAQKIKAAKKTAAAQIADCFFTYLFAFALCALPCLALSFVLWLIGTVPGLRVLCILAILAAALLALRGYAEFVLYFQKTKVRRFDVIYKSLAKHPFRYIVQSEATVLLAALPALTVYFLPRLFRAPAAALLFFEAASIVAAYAGVCFALSWLLARRCDMESLRFSSSFSLQLVVTILTRGVWLIFLLPHLVLSASIYFDTKQKEHHQ